MAKDHRTRRLSPEEMFESRVNTETLNTSAAILTVCSANMTHDCFMVMSCCLSSGFRIRDEASLRHRPPSVFPILELDFLVGKFQSGHQKKVEPFPARFLPGLSALPRPPSPCAETEGFSSRPRQWAIWEISCAPVSYDFVPRRRCSAAFCLAGPSRGSQTSLFLRSPFHVAVRE